MSRSIPTNQPWQVFLKLHTYDDLDYSKLCSLIILLSIVFDKQKKNHQSCLELFLSVDNCVSAEYRLYTYTTMPAF